MPITRLNHAVLFVRDVARSSTFYCEVLGFEVVPMAPVGMNAVFLQAPGSTNDHDLGLFELGGSGQPSPAASRPVGLYHLAWEVDTLAELERLATALEGADALVGAADHGTTKSLYGRDVDGLEFEIAWVVPADQLTDDAVEARQRIGPLDLSAEQRRYGAHTQGGVGISQPAGA